MGVNVCTHTHTHTHTHLQRVLQGVSGGRWTRRVWFPLTASKAWTGEVGQEISFSGLYRKLYTLKNAGLF